METESFNAGDQPHDFGDYAALVRDVQYLKVALATLAEQVLRQQSLSQPAPIAVEDTIGDDDEDRAIHAYLNGTPSPAEREEIQTAIDHLAALVRTVAARNGLTEEELADRFDAARHATAISE